MHINKKATNISLSPSVEDYVEKRLQSLGKFIDLNDPTLLVNLELARTTRHHHSGDIFMAEVTLHVGGQTFRAVSERDDLLKAIDDMKDELLRELRTSKSKKMSLLRRGGQNVKDFLKGVSLFRNFKNWRRKP